LALSTSAWSVGAVAQTAAPTPAPDAAAAPPADAPAPKAKKPHHAIKKVSKEKPTAAGDKAVDDLNAESLDAAKANKSFTPPAVTKVSDTKPVKATKPMKKKKKAAKKEAEAPADAAAAPADTTKK
jgi:hypothetical protein